MSTGIQIPRICVGILHPPNLITHSVQLSVRPFYNRKVMESPCRRIGGTCSRFGHDRYALPVFSDNPFPLEKYPYFSWKVNHKICIRHTNDTPLSSATTLNAFCVALPFNHCDISNTIQRYYKNSHCQHIPNFFFTFFQK